MPARRRMRAHPLASARARPRSAVSRDMRPSTTRRADRPYRRLAVWRIHTHFLSLSRSCTRTKAADAALAMEGGLDVDAHAAPAEELQPAGGEAEAEPGNKFQKAIGAWRGRLGHALHRTVAAR